VAACEKAVWPAGTFDHAYKANRRTAIETSIEADPVAACVREIMAERSSWTGSAADLLRAGAGPNSNGPSRDGTGWPKNPRALAGRLRRAQTFLRVLGIDIAFSREGRAGSRMIRIRTTREGTVSTISSVCDQSSPRPASACNGSCRPDLVSRDAIEQVPAATDDADGADAKTGLRFG
jgi:hypothetical protein